MKLVHFRSCAQAQLLFLYQEKISPNPLNSEEVCDENLISGPEQFSEKGKPPERVGRKDMGAKAGFPMSAQGAGAAMPARPPEFQLLSYNIL